MNLGTTLDSVVSEGLGVVVPDLVGFKREINPKYK